MSRALTLGNGGVAVNLDDRGQVRDFYFPFVGQENHVGGNLVHRIGVFVDGRLAWLDDPSWQVKVGSESDTLMSKIEAVNESLGVALFSSDLVYNEKDIFVRRLAIRNLLDRGRQIKIFFGQQFELYESYAAHTAYYDPRHHALIHYRNQRVFLVNAQLGGKPFDDYTTGLFASFGLEGSHRDAGDGRLAQNPIEHGQVDSVLGLTADYGPQGEQLVYYWVAAATSIAKALELNDYTLANGPGHLLETASRFWQAWVNRRQFNFFGLKKEVVDLFNRSLLLIRAHTDNRGGIIASSDSSIRQQGKDTYNYVWPRDAAFAALALARAGDETLAKNFFAFCNQALTDEGYLMHKYSPDGSLGSSWHPWFKDGKERLPIQEDETAVVLFALWLYYQISKDLEFVEAVYNSFIKRTADFMVLFRDETTRLPRPSYDLWEEHFSVNTYTAAAVAGALGAASGFAKVLGKFKSEQIYREAAEEVKAAILRCLYDPQEKTFYKSLIFADGQWLPDRTSDAASVYGLFAFGLLAPSDPLVTEAVRRVGERLSCGRTGGVGGEARYENDRFHRVDDSFPGNPWIVTTLWFIEHQIRIARAENELESVRRGFDWVTNFALPAGVLAEQLHPKTGAPLSAAPLVWSHAAFVNAVIAYLDKLEELGICKACNPVY